MLWRTASTLFDSYSRGGPLIFAGEWVQRMFATNVGDHVLPVTASAAGLYYSATVDSRSRRVYLKVVNPATQATTAQLTFTGSTASAASVQVLTGDPSAGNTLTAPPRANPG